ncbi:ethylene-responsive transcription factor ERF021-like [Rutidosis leptorrhynchoides]|uniref:ethylene-responsive transcription factor ERF021-like n=1 Tax=Rutidosis leptorrhynchoides TaxID=125765 RepID=UPI003A99BE9A
MSDTHSSSGGTSSVYRGVRKRKWGKWVSEIRAPMSKSRIWLGSFETPEMAAIAHDAISFYFRGDNARLNFPQMATSLPRPATSSTHDIRVAAQEATSLVLTHEFDAGSSSNNLTVPNNIIPTNVGLSASEIQAINDSPLDYSHELWDDPQMSFPNIETNFDHMNNNWDDIPDDSLWDP